MRFPATGACRLSRQSSLPVPYPSLTTAPAVWLSRAASAPEELLDVGGPRQAVPRAEGTALQPCHGGRVREDVRNVGVGAGREVAAEEAASEGVASPGAVDDRHVEGRR